MRHDYKYLIHRDAATKARRFNLAGVLLVAGVVLCAVAITSLRTAGNHQTLTTDVTGESK